jgi:hypothetical protein
MDDMTTIFPRRFFVRRSVPAKAPADTGVDSIRDLLSPYLMALAATIEENPLDRDLQLNVFADLVRSIQQIQVVAGAAEQNALAQIGWDIGPRGGRHRAVVHIAGLGSFTGSKPTIKNEWHEGTLGKALEAARERGEINNPADVAPVVERVLYAGIQFKKKELVALGLDPKELCDSQYGAEKLRWI